MISSEEYLKAERLAETRSEYHQGSMYAMAGASRDHNRILTNSSTYLDVQLKDRDCNNYSSDMRTHVTITQQHWMIK